MTTSVVTHPIRVVKLLWHMLNQVG